MQTADFLRFSDPLPEPMLLLRGDGMVLAANRKAALLLGIDRRPVGVRFVDLVTDPPQRVEEYLRLAAKRGDLGPGRLTLRTARDGSLSVSCRGVRMEVEGAAASVLIRIDPVSSLTGNFLELNAQIARLHSEIAQRQQAEEDLRLLNDELARARDEALGASRAKSEFLANMSHELRTPLNAIIGYAEMLQEELLGRGEGQIAGDLDRIRLSGRHLLGLIGDILDLSRIEEGKLDIECEAFDPGEVAREALILVAPLLEKNGNRGRLEGESPGAFMCSDRTRVRQILFNLLSNAAKFTQNGLVVVSYQRDGDWMVMQVSDTGIGIAEEHQERLFTKFFQVDGSPRRRYGGSGLGLSITKLLCELMGGRVELKSDPGRGSVFTAVLPVDSRPVLAQRGDLQSEVARQPADER